MIFLLVAGIGALAAGLLAIVFGVPIKEFGFGNTLILSGVIGTCTGLLMLGLWMAVREIKALAVRMSEQGAGSGTTRPAVARDRAPPPLVADAAESRRSDPAIETTTGARAMPISVTDLPPVSDTQPPRRDDRQAPEPVAVTEPEAKSAEGKRRNLLFSSMSRKERERKAAEGGTSDVAGDPAVRKTFDDAWPERARADAVRRPRPPSTFADKGDEAGPPPEGPAAVTVLKSGVVDGMAYSLYSDGSIEAQMPEGMMRFASIDELRAHLDQRP